MSTHAFWSPSKGHMWMHCLGAMAMPENQRNGGSSTFADDGSVSHVLLDWTLKAPERECAQEIGKEYEIEGRYTSTIDEDRAARIQDVVDDVRRRAIGGVLWLEYRVDLSDVLGPEQGGTSDVVILQPLEEEITVLDLKDGSGEKVWASYGDESLPPHKRINKQLGLYLVGVWKDASMMGTFTKGRVVINQPKLGHIDEFVISYDELMAFASEAGVAVNEGAYAMTLPLDSADFRMYLKPNEHACRWCQAKATCPALAAFVQDTVKAEFEMIAAEPPLVPAGNQGHLSAAMGAVPLVEQWCKAVRTEVWNRTAAGTEVIGPDGKPFKFVEGKGGKRVWDDEVKAESSLVGLIGDKAYKPREIITAPAAAKILDKKKTKETWADVFVPLIRKTQGSIQLALGSDPRPPATGAAAADEFQDDLEV